MIIAAALLLSMITMGVVFIHGPIAGPPIFYVDNSLTQQVTVEIDGTQVGRLFPDFMEKYHVEKGKRKITLRDPKGGIADEIEVTLSTSGPYIYNPGAKRQYELKTIAYSTTGLGDNWTRTFGPGRWHEITERVDYVFEHPPDQISSKYETKKIWLRQVK